MKIVKNITFIIIFLALLVMSLMGVVLLNRGDEDTDDYLLSDIKSTKYSQYSKIFLEHEDLRQIKDFEGKILSHEPKYVDKIRIRGNLESVKKRQGSKFKVSEIIYKDSNTVYKAKFNGVVDRIYKKGHDIIIVLSNYDNRYIGAEIPVKYVQYLKLGKNIKFTYGGHTKKGRISYIATTAENNMVPIEIKFEDKHCQMFTNANVILKVVKKEVKSAIAVPEKALICSNDEYFVRIQDEKNDDGKLVPVTIGMKSDEGEVEIKEGLDTDDIVLFETSKEIIDSDDKK